MSQQQTKHRYSLRDHLTAYLVLIVIASTILVGAAVLYFTGIFEPVAQPQPLVDTPGLDLATESPRASLLSWLIPTARAEAEAEMDAGEAPVVLPLEVAPQTIIPPQTENDLTQLLDEIMAEERDEEEIPADQRVTVDKGDLSVNPNLPDDIYNVLLLATDTRDMNASSGRSDVMIITSINMKTNEINLTSLSRDLWVPLPNGAGSNKLNAAYAFGGPLLAVKTVNSLFEMNIQDYIVVNFAMMASLVDTLGGVDIYLEGVEYAYINYNVAVSEDYEGFPKSTSRRTLTEADADTTVHLDGLQAVSYARIRKLDNDFQRGSRQRVLLQAMMDKGLANLSLSTFYGLANNMMTSVSTNINLVTVMEIGTWLLGLEDFPAMNEMSIPLAGSYHSDTEKDMSVVKFNQAQNVEALHAFLFGEYIPAGAAQ